MKEKPIIKISVRELAEFALKGGDLSFSLAEGSRMQEGANMHRAIQAAAGQNYSSEVSISYLYEIDFAILEISGRIDGLINENGKITVDEIKTQSRMIDSITQDDNPHYWAQAKIYAFVYASQNALKEISVRLTYYSHKNSAIKYFYQDFNISDLEAFLKFLIDFYVCRLRAVNDWREIRDLSIARLKFPFGNYRKGQREMAVFVYKAVKAKRVIFAEAPTGTGKTAAALFPSVKALGESLCSKIFYLTAKNITRSIAENALKIMRNEGLKIKSVVITAKEKACPYSEMNCDPEECECAKGYYNRLNAAIGDIFALDEFNFENISKYAQKHCLCPFEFSLDLSLLSDVIICDYNYLFDPRVYLRRFFEEGPGDFCFLIDEAHNLVERAREMYSAELSGEKITQTRRIIRKIAPALYKKLGAVVKIFKGFLSAQLNEKDFVPEKEICEELVSRVKQFTDAAREWFSDQDGKNECEELLELFFDFLSFIRIAELYAESHLTCYRKESKNYPAVKLFCIDPAVHLARAAALGRSAIYFSATLSPIPYFIRILGGGAASPFIRLDSPFDDKNLCVMAELGVETRYKRRDESYDKIAALIKEILCAKRGNYLVFFPSYAYLKNVVELFEIAPADSYKIIVQQSGMSENERSEFLNHFDDGGGGVVGFAVMGGVFGEGIDLVGDRLSGAIIIGVGLPQVSDERELISQYFDAKNLSGFDYAYVFPGINRVLQAAGRVIRTENDRGVVCLIDSRFALGRYRELLPKRWLPYKAISSARGAARILLEFFGENRA